MTKYFLYEGISRFSTQCHFDDWFIAKNNGFLKSWSRVEVVIDCSSSEWYIMLYYVLTEMQYHCAALQKRIQIRFFVKLILITVPNSWLCCSVAQCSVEFQVSFSQILRETNFNHFRLRGSITAVFIISDAPLWKNENITATQIFSSNQFRVKFLSKSYFDGIFATWHRGKTKNSLSLKKNFVKSTI